MRVHDWDGSVVRIYVTDVKKERQTPVKIGMLGLNEQPAETVWSRDGSLVAIRADERSGAKFVIGYDFKDRRAVKAPHRAKRPDAFEEPTVEEQDAFIKALLEERGGSQTAVFKAYQGRGTMTWFEARRFVP